MISTSRLSVIRRYMIITVIVVSLHGLLISSADGATTVVIIVSIIPIVGVFKLLVQ